MKLWLISQDKNNDYDTYDSAVVAAYTEKEAANTHPQGPKAKWDEMYGTWASSPKDVKVTFLGDAVQGTKAGVVLASFNAG